MTPAFIEGLRALAPELVLTLTAFGVLVVELLCTVRDSRRAAWMARVGLVATAGLLLLRMNVPAASVFGMLQVDGFAKCLKLLMTLGSFVVLQMWMSKRRTGPAISVDAIFLLLCGILGGFLMVTTNHALLLLLGFELLSLASYALVGLQPRIDSGRKSARRFFARSALASGLLIYGLSLFYGLTGTLDFARVGAAGLAALLQAHPWPVVFALCLIFAGLTSKLQLGFSRILEGYVHAFFATVSRVAGFGALLRILSALFVQDSVATAMAPHTAKISIVLAVLAALTMTIANVAALKQTGLRRMLACTSIAQTGFALIGVTTLNETGFAAAIVYLAISAMTSAGSFALASHFEAIAGSDQLADLRGLGRSSPLAGSAMIVLLASSIGLAPTVGFHGVVRLFLEGWNAGPSWLVVIAAVNLLIATAVAFRIVGALFFEQMPTAAPVRSARLVVLAMTLAGASLVLGVWTRPLDQWANAALDLLRGLR